MTKSFLLSRRSFVNCLVVCAALVPAGGAKVFAQGSLSAIKIATIGSGREGGALGTLFAKAGHPVLFSSLHPEELKDLVAAAGPKARAGTAAEAVAFGDVIFLAVPYTAIPQIGHDFGAALAAKELVLDVSNPVVARDGQDLVNQVMSQGGPGLVTQKYLSGAKLVRGFNAIGGGTLDKLAHQPGEKVGVPIAGDDAKAIDLASRLIREVGFEPVLVGGLAKGKYLVPGTALSGTHSAAELRQATATLN